MDSWHGLQIEASLVEEQLLWLVFPSSTAHFPLIKTRKCPSNLFVKPGGAVGPLNSLWPLVSVANEVIKPHDIFDATEESPLDLTFCRTILLVSRTHTQLPAVPRAVQSFQYANAQFTRRHPRTGYWMLRSIWAYVHIGPQIFRFRLRRAAPSVQNTALHSSKPGFICSETIFCISFRFAGFVLQICKNAAICGQHVRRASRVINGINIPSWPGNLNISSSADAAFLAVVKGKKNCFITMLTFTFSTSADLHRNRN